MMKSKTDEYRDFKELLDESKADLSSYIEKKMLLAKLKIYEKVASTFSRIVYGLLLCIFALILFILMFLGLGLFIGESLNNNYSLGFGVVTLFVFLILLLVVTNSKRIRKFLMNITLSTIKKIELDEE